MAPTGDHRHSAQRGSEGRAADARALIEAAIFDAMPASIALVDESGTIMSVNESWRRFAADNGADPAAVGPGANYFEVCDRAATGGDLVAAQAADWFRAVLRGDDRAYVLEYPCHSPGEERWFHLTASLLAPPAPRRALVMHVDITARRMAESVLRLRGLMLDQIGEAVIAADTSGRIIYANQVALEMYRGPLEQLMGQITTELATPHQAQDEPRAVLARLLRGDSWRGELELRDFTGRQFMTAVTATPLLADDGSVAGIVAIAKDITARKRADEALAASERRYRDLVETSQDVIWSLDADGRITFLNQAASSVLGRDPQEMVGHHIRAFVTREEALAVAKVVTDALDAGHEVVQYTTRVTRADGSVATLSANARPVRDRDDRIVAWNGISRDMTERLSAEQALRESEARLRGLFEQYRLLFTHNPHPMWTFDTATLRFRAVNAAAINRYGYSEDEFLGMTIRDLHPPEELERLERELSAPPDARTRFALWRHRLKNGTVIDVEVSSEAVLFDGRPARLGMANDVTERLEAQQRIAEQAALLEQANDTIIVRDLDQRVVFWNNSAERLFGWTKDEAMQRLAPELLEVDRRAYYQAYAAVLDHGEWSGELQKRTKTGELRSVATRWTLLRDREGRPRSVLAIENDITEKKRLEAQVLRAQRMESIGTLAGGIAHDLNNVLAPIMMSVELLRMDLPTGQRTSILDTLAGSASRGVQLVNQVLSFARGIDGERVAVDLLPILNDLANVVAETFPKDVTLELVEDDGLSPVTGDATQLHQVFLNLCVNARDAMPDGGRLTIRVRPAVIDEAAAAANLEARPGRYMLVQVEDTGSGIAVDVRDRIFEPFFTTKEFGKGTGLGLSTSLTIVRSHGGFFDISSEVGKGTRFDVYLPALPSLEPVETTPADPRVLPRGRGELVLVVDDEPGVRHIVQRTLERFGYRVLLAGDGAEALSIYSEWRPDIDVVLTDMGMPVMNGPALIRALRAMDPGVRIIGSSGLSSDGGASDALGANAHFVSKPYTAEAILRTLDEVLGPDRG